ncbi:hypothetical protein [Streptomyces sp. SID3343]|uniref:hypothetical protein n=1 Tax=Streptomyces sp. SID3343 TaxID=2690260 RepID=UPI00136A6B23|nr:hypothetical protein [Streptomyces sp. SID3343]MYW04526.1 hypothetical protein [Streptomyces sp. SID3343]
MTENSHPADCPMPNAHRRLMDCHATWHAMADAYMEPDSFRMHLNTLIQSLRNVTWLLQKQKNNLPGFETWYPILQEEMKTKEVMRWIVKSRNRIVKEADLELLSQVKVQWMRDWLNGGHQVFSFPPRLSTESMIQGIFSMPSRPYEGVLTIARRWVDKELPERELLDATRDAYIELNRVILVAHEQVGHGYLCYFQQREPECVTGELANEPIMCMDTVPSYLRANISLDDERVIEGVEEFIPHDPALNAKAVRRYGSFSTPLGSPVDVAPRYLEQGKIILAKDKAHHTFVWLFRGEKIVHEMVPMFQDQNSKYLALNRIADAVESVRADGLLFMGESWYAMGEKLTDAGKMIPARDRADKKEALVVDAITRKGEARALMATFERTFWGKIIFADDVIDEDIFPNFLVPIRERWTQMERQGN